MSHKLATIDPGTDLSAPMLATDGERVFDLTEEAPLAGTPEVEANVVVSAATKAMNDYRVAVQGIIGSWIRLSGLQLPDDDGWGRAVQRVDGRGNFQSQPKQRVDDVEKLTRTTYRMLVGLGNRCLRILGRHPDSDPVVDLGCMMFGQLLDVYARVKSERDPAPGVIMAIHWFECDGIMRDRNFGTVERGEAAIRWRRWLDEAHAELDKSVPRVAY